MLSMSVFISVPHCFDYCNFVVNFDIRKCESSSFVLFPKILLAIWGPLRFHMNFRMGFSISAKNDIGIFIVIILNLEITLGSIDILTILSPPIHEHECVAIYLHCF